LWIGYRFGYLGGGQRKRFRLLQHVQRQNTLRDELLLEVANVD